MNAKMVKKTFLQTRAKLAEHPIEKVGADLKSYDALDN